MQTDGRVPEQDARAVALNMVKADSSEMLVCDELHGITTQKAVNFH